MNPMKEAWNLLKGDPQWQMRAAQDTGKNRQQMGIDDTNLESTGGQVPPVLRQKREIEPTHHRNFRGGNDYKGYQRGRWKGEGPKMPVNRDNLWDDTGYRSIGHNYGAGSPTNRQESDYGTTDLDNQFMGQSQQIVGRAAHPNPGQVDSLETQAGPNGKYSGFESKNYGRFFNRDPANRKDFMQDAKPFDQIQDWNHPAYTTPQQPQQAQGQQKQVPVISHQRRASGFHQQHVV